MFEDAVMAVLNKKVLEALEHALKNCNVVIVSGPAGCGKEIAISALAKKLNFAISTCPMEETTPLGVENNVPLRRNFLPPLNADSQPQHQKAVNPPLPPSRHLCILKDLASLFSSIREWSSSNIAVALKKRVTQLCKLAQGFSVALVFVLDAEGPLAFEFRQYILSVGQDKTTPRSSALTEIKFKELSITALKRLITILLKRFKLSAKACSSIVATVPEAALFNVQTVLDHLNNVLFSHSPKFASPELYNQPVLQQTKANLPVTQLMARESPIELFATVSKILYNKRIPSVCFAALSQPPLSLPSIGNLFPRFRHFEPVFGAIYPKHLNSPDNERSKWLDEATRLPQRIEGGQELVKQRKQLPREEMFPKHLRPPSYFDLRKFYVQLEGPPRATVVDLLLQNYVYFFGEIDDCAEFLDQVAFIDTLFPKYEKMAEVQIELICRAAMDSNLSPQQPSRSKISGSHSLHGYALQPPKIKHILRQSKLEWHALRKEVFTNYPTGRASFATIHCYPDFLAVVLPGIVELARNDPGTLFAMRNLIPEDIFSTIFEASNVDKQIIKTRKGSTE